MRVCVCVRARYHRLEDFDHRLRAAVFKHRNLERRSATIGPGTGSLAAVAPSTPSTAAPKSAVPRTVPRARLEYY